MAELEVDTRAGFTSGFDEVPVALRALRARFLEVCQGLDAGDWGRPSRCELWTVHDLARHVADACRRHVEFLKHGRTPFSPADPFDARETPRRWLEQTAGQTPAETLAALADLCAEEARALLARMKEPDGPLQFGPYGPVHWSPLSAHVLWDAWLHERDVSEALGIGSAGTPPEDRVAALYALLLASVPAVLRGHDFHTTLRLTARDGTNYRASVAPGRASLSADHGADHGAAHPDLQGELVPVVESLAGRGEPPAAVLHGDPSALEPLTWLRPVLMPRS